MGKYMCLIDLPVVELVASMDIAFQLAMVGCLLLFLTSFATLLLNKNAGQCVTSSG